MFKVIPDTDRTFTHDVTVFTPVDGGYLKETLKVTYNYIDLDERKKFDITTSEGTEAFLKRVVRKLDDLTDEKNQPVPYSDELRDRVLKLNPVRQAVSNGFFQATSNEGPKQGN
jgi:hypothetical protein